MESREEMNQDFAQQLRRKQRRAGGRSVSPGGGLEGQPGSKL